MGGIVEKEVQSLLQGALQAARDVVETNRQLHEEISALLSREEKIEGEELQRLLGAIKVGAVQEWGGGGVQCRSGVANS